MIPRLRPYFGLDDLSAATLGSSDSLTHVEGAFAKVLGFKHSLLLSLGRTAIYLYLNHIGAKGKKVLVTAYNCRVVYSTVLFAGAIPKYVDVGRSGFNADIEDISAAIDSDTVAVILTSMYGYPYRKEDIALLRSRHPGVKLIGDCALAIFSRQDGYYFADEMDLNFYAFGIGKQVSIVEGGLLTTNDGNLFEKLKNLRDSTLTKAALSLKFKRWLLFLGGTVMFHNTMYGLLQFVSEKTSLLSSMKGSDTAIKELMPSDWKYFPSSFQCSVGLSQIRKFSKNREKRANIVDKYFKAFSEKQSEKFTLPPYFPFLSHFPILSNERDALQDYLFKKGIHATNVFRELPWDLALVKESCVGDFPRSRDLRDRCLLLPLYAQLSNRSCDYVIDTINRWL